jgi:hypothetical protein
MATEETKRRFLQEIKLRGYDDKYIDVAEEKEILKIALESGSDLDAARQAMLQICEKHDFMVESVILNKLRELIQTFVGNDGKLDEREFNDTLALAKRATGGKKTDRECKIMVLKLIEEDGSKIKTGMMSNWYKRVKKEVGLA